MLRMDGFEICHARTADEAVSLREAHPDAMYVAGGTDLLPNLKHRILRPSHVIGLGGALPTGWSRVEDPSSPTGWTWEIGAGTRLSQLATLRALPPLAQAAGLVAGPQIRNMGTLGGNVLLDTRCLYFNQTEFWRKSLGYCLKAEGDWCHVIGGPKTCVATQSSDTVPVLLAMGASVRLLGSKGTRELRLRELYRFDGKDHLKLQPGELLTHIRVPEPAPGFRGSYQKLRPRGSIDFPQLSVAITGTWDGPGPQAPVLALDVVVGAINPQPKPIRGLEPFLGRPLDADVITAISELVRAQTRPQGSVAGDEGWRRHMAVVYARRGLGDLCSAGIQ